MDSTHVGWHHMDGYPPGPLPQIPERRRGLLGIVVIIIVALEKGVTASAFSGPRVHI